MYRRPAYRTLSTYITLVMLPLLLLSSAMIAQARAFQPPCSSQLFGYRSFAAGRTIVHYGDFLKQQQQSQIVGLPIQATSKSSGPEEFTDADPDYVRNPDYSILVDHNGEPVTVDRLLATKPLRHELMTRPGPGGRDLTYVSGDSVTRNLNDIFGFDGWSLQIIKSEKTVCVETDGPRGKGWQVAYSAHVRITHTKSGTYKEDMGGGDAMDKSLATADQNALKASVTDALKRAARHFGDKLGNSLYDSEFNMKVAPDTLQEALELYDHERAETKFGAAAKKPISRAKKS